MEMREKSEEMTQLQSDLTLNENQPKAETESVVNPVNEPETQEDTKPQCEDVTVDITEQPVGDEIAETVQTDVKEAEKPQSAPMPATVPEILAAVELLSARNADEISREEVARLKQHFYAMRKAADEEALKAFTEAGNSPEAFASPDMAADEEFKRLLSVIKDKKAERAAQLEAEMQRNFELKESLIAELAAMSADTDNVNRSFPRFREIQQEFKTVGEVSPQQMTDQWKRYQDAVEHFYDQLKVNKDLRDYDFRKNLDTKLHLCQEAESLADEADTVTAFKRLQSLHVKWRETGPVAKDIREEIWTRFKDASAVINKKYQAFFEERKQREQENEIANIAICERVEALDFESIKSFNGWNAMTKTILEAQEDWKKLGFASRKSNNALFARFRATCDRFFSMKAEYYRTVKDDMAANLEKKTALCEQAEALKDSTDWKATADKLIALQKEWKQIGAVSKKHSDAIWTRFQAACDYFFEQKKKDLSDLRHTEQANLKAKRALTASLREISAETPREEVLASIREAQARWSEIGHVPFRDKDRIYDEFRAVINDLYKTHDLRESRNSMARFESSISEISDGSKLSRERERLARVLEQKRADLTTYQNNLGFFSFKSASASSMLRDIERKTQRLKDDIEELEQKIRLIDDKL